MEFRKAHEADLSSIMKIIEQARVYFREHEIDQWQNGYPNSETVLNDISKGYSFVLLEDSCIIGTVAVSFDGESTYNRIYEGKWLSEASYAVVHRLAVEHSLKGTGIASVIMRNVEAICLDNNVFSIKVDTHRKNISMQRLLHKNGFQYCGIIYLDDGSERLAYEKLLKNIPEYNLLAVSDSI